MRRVLHGLAIDKGLFGMSAIDPRRFKKVLREKVLRYVMELCGKSRV